MVVFNTFLNSVFVPKSSIKALIIFFSSTTLFIPPVQNDIYAFFPATSTTIPFLLHSKTIFQLTYSSPRMQIRNFF